jgi:hypothetical protein
MSDDDPISNLRRLLAARMVAGANLYRKGDPASQRRGAAFQAHALLDLCDVILTGSELPAAVSAPLRHLVIALVGLDQGERDPLLAAPKGKTGRPKLSSERTGQRAHAAACMEFLVAAGERLERAAEEAGKKFGAEPEEIQDWREQALRERPVDNLLAARFRAIVDYLTERHPGDPRAAASYLIRR